VGIGKALILPTEMVCATHVSDNEMKTFVWSSSYLVLLRVVAVIAE
jgi:hypothetical protein